MLVSIVYARISSRLRLRTNRYPLVFPLTHLDTVSSVTTRHRLMSDLALVVYRLKQFASHLAGTNVRFSLGKHAFHVR